MSQPLNSCSAQSNLPSATIVPVSPSSIVADSNAPQMDPNISAQPETKDTCLASGPLWSLSVTFPDVTEPLRLGQPTTM